MMVDMKQIFVTDNYQDEGHGHEILVVHFGLVRTLVFISCMSSKRLLIWPENQRSKSFNFYTTSPINWDMGRAATILDLLQCWSEKRDSHTANDGVDIFPLELCPAKSLYCVCQELDLVQSYLEMQLCVSLLISIRTSKHERCNFIKRSKSLRFSSSYDTYTWL